MYKYAIEGAEGITEPVARWHAFKQGIEPVAVYVEDRTVYLITEEEAVRSLQTAVKAEARLLRRIVRVMRSDYTGTD